MVRSTAAMILTVSMLAAARFQQGTVPTVTSPHGSQDCSTADGHATRLTGIGASPLDAPMDSVQVTGWPHTPCWTVSVALGPQRSRSVAISRHGSCHPARVAQLARAGAL